MFLIWKAVIQKRNFQYYQRNPYFSSQLDKIQIAEAPHKWQLVTIIRGRVQTIPPW